MLRDLRRVEESYGDDSKVAFLLQVGSANHKSKKAKTFVLNLHYIFDMSAYERP